MYNPNWVVYKPNLLAKAVVDQFLTMSFIDITQRQLSAQTSPDLADEIVLVDRFVASKLNFFRQKAREGGEQPELKQRRDRKKAAFYSRHCL
jgi:hypothetical protein